MLVAQTDSHLQALNFLGASVPFVANASQKLPTELQQPARSTLLSPDRSVLKTFIFSTKVMRAVSVASPTFSYTPLF